MANSRQLSSGMVAAEPEPIDLDWSAPRSSSSTCSAISWSPAASAKRSATTSRSLRARWSRSQRCSSAARDLGMLVVHTREGHLPDLSDAPPAKIERGAPSLAHRRSRADGTDPDPRRSRPRHHSGAVSARQRDRHRQARQGRVLRDRTRRHPAEIRHREFAGVRRDHRGLRQHHGARGQRPRLSLRRAGRRLRLLFPRIPRDGPEDDQGPGWHLRLGHRTRPRFSRQ